MTDTKPSTSHRGLVAALIIGGVTLCAAALFVLIGNEDQKTVTPAPAPDESVRNVFAHPEPILNEPIPEVVEKPIRTPDTDAADTLQRRVAPSVRDRDSSSRPPTTTADATTTGTMDPKILGDFIQSRFAALRTCYEKRLKVRPELEGIVDLRIVVLSTGRVSSVQVNSDGVGDDPMRECMLSTVRGWTFPRPEGGRIVFDKPFHFRKQN